MAVGRKGLKGMGGDPVCRQSNTTEKGFHGSCEPNSSRVSLSVTVLFLKSVPSIY